MTDKNEPLYHIEQLDKKIDRTGDDIKSRIDNLEKICAKAEEVKQHYATKFFAGAIAVSAFLVLCGAYMVITPMFIDYKNNTLNKDVNNILEIVKSIEAKSEPHSDPHRTK